MVALATRDRVRGLCSTIGLAQMHMISTGSAADWGVVFLERSERNLAG